VFTRILLLLSLIVATQPLFAGPDVGSSILVSVPDQKLVLLENGCRMAEYPISTSKYGLGDRFGSYATPTGSMEIAQKIGGGYPIGAVFKNRQPTGEVLRPNAPGRDPIVTRIIWLRGLDASSRNAFSRNIYIHGTPVERLIGRPASYGCIRMRSKDIVDLYNRVGVGARVNVSTSPVHRAIFSFAATTPGRGSAG